MNKPKITHNRIFLYLGIFFISASLLGIELLFTRVAKVAFGQGFQFILVSLAILGIGIGAMVVYFFFNSKKYKPKINEISIKYSILIFSLLYAILIFVPFFVINNVIIDFEGAYTYQKTEILAAKLSFFFAAFILYLAWGFCVSIIFSHYSKLVSSLYLSNLTGSAFGGLITIVLMNALGVPKTLVIIYIISLAAVILFGFCAKIKLKHIAIATLLLAGYLYFAPQVNIVCETNQKRIFSESNSFSQVDTYEIPPFLIKRYWGTDYDFSQVDENISIYRMIIDCIGGTDFVEYNEGLSSTMLLHDSRAIPHLLKNYSRVLIVGSGAGIDVVRAISMNSKIVDAVEINPLITRRLEKLVKPQINVYNQNNVNLYLEEARNFVSKSNVTYDFIYIPGAKRYGGASIALYSFLENYLFTEEAFEAYFNHLSEDGVLAITDPHWFILRYLQVGTFVMGKLGMQTENKAVLVMGSERSLLIFKKNGINDDENGLLRDAATRFKEMYQIIDKETLNYLGIDYVSVDDDHPFYWNIYNKENFLKEELTKFGSFVDQKKENFPSLDSFFMLFLSILAVYAIFIIAPLFTTGHKTAKSNILLLIAYFSALGIGFIMIELVLMQKFVLLLGHPTYSMAVVLSSLLFFSGVGSFTTKSFKFKKQSIAIIIATIFISIFIYILFSKIILSKLIYAGLATRIFFSAAVVAIPAFFMGMLFPIGIKLTEKLSKGLIPWMWGINGIASTLGGVASMILSLLFGFNAALFVGVSAYLLGAAAIMNMKF